MKRVDVVSAIVYDDQGHLLVVKNIKDGSFYWSPPGGAVEKGETLEQATIREVKEETGYDIVLTGFHSVREKIFPFSGNHVLFFTFHAKIVGGELSINDPDNDITQVQWVVPHVAKELMPDLFQSLKLGTDTVSPIAYYAIEGKQ